MPERDDAAQPDSTRSSAQASTTPPDTSPGGTPTVTISKPTLGAVFDRIPVHKVSPVIEGGAYPAKAVVGESIPIRATVFREGHDAVNASVVLTDPNGTERLEPMHPTTPLGFDWWTATVVFDTEGLWTYRVEGWSDPWETWVHNAEIKIPAGIDVELVCADGRALFERSAADAEVAGDTRNTALLRGAAKNLDSGQQVEDRLEVVLADDVRAAMKRFGPREMVSPTPDYPIFVDRRKALFSSWYEFFPRSQGARWDEENERWISGTFDTSHGRLEAAAAMGFDVVYLPPIHPIGRTFRKGPNNTLAPGPSDPGSPWAIGAEEGGHDAIHPDLGDFDAFDRFVEKAKSLGLEVAMDFALQASPDHPWVTEHPEWFSKRADGTIAYAENPPKKYQDIYPINFDNDPEGIYAECLRVIRVWVDAGVRIFRVDNPHTKPLNFWHWLIWEVKRTDPDVLFLAEAFTRPAMMHQLARIGFTQSYTYFTWRTQRWELAEYGQELAANAHYMRPNFFVNTPDILHASLQFGGPPMFKIRAALAAMMSPTWGVYAGYELFEHVAVRPGSEEYLDSEKYQLRPRDWAAAEASGRSLAPYLRRLNEIRRAHPALQQLRTLRFHPTDNENLICFSKTDPGSQDAVLVVLNLSSHHTQIGTTALDLPALGLDWHERFHVRAAITGATYDWGQFNYLELDPYREPAHVFAVTLPRSEEHTSE